MKKVLILAEGPTEEAFIKRVLAEKLPGLWLVPTVVKTKVTGPRPMQGGSVSYPELKRQLLLLLRDSSASMVTTMFDFQGFCPDFPARANPAGGTSSARAEFVQAAMKADLEASRYLPFLVLHEFEALLFAKPKVIAEVLRRPALAGTLEAVHRKPEEINDSPATSPSARIENACAELFGSAKIFQKRTHGPIIAGRIGLEQIRAECPHFNAWMGKLEAFAAA